MPRRKRDTRSEILVRLRPDVGITSQALAARLGLSHAVVKRHLHLLKEEGLVQCEEGFGYPIHYARQLLWFRDTTGKRKRQEGGNNECGESTP